MAIAVSKVARHSSSGERYRETVLVSAQSAHASDKTTEGEAVTMVDTRDPLFCSLAGVEGLVCGSLAVTVFTPLKGIEPSYVKRHSETLRASRADFRSPSRSPKADDHRRRVVDRSSIGRRK